MDGLNEYKIQINDVLAKSETIHADTLDEAIELIKTETRHYAKRQLTWFRKYDDAIWLDGGKDDENVSIIIENYKQ